MNKRKNIFAIESNATIFFRNLKTKTQWMRRRIRALWSDQKEKDYVRTVKEFQTFKFDDPEFGLSLKYNLFIPKNFDPDEKYPLVLFIHDAGVISNDPKITLIQGIGATIWATPSEQEKHPCFVLAPQYPRVIVNDDSEATEELEVTVNLVNKIKEQYPIDEKRIYTTGQSMGCMSSIEMMVRYPDLYAAALLVAGQWDPQRMSALWDRNLWIVVSEKDPKAFPGMNASLVEFESAGAKISRANWPGDSSAEAFKSLSDAMITKGNKIQYSVFDKGTVVPADLPDDGLNNHTHTWHIAYTIEGIRDWLFSQRK